MSREWDLNPRTSVSKTDEISQTPLPPDDNSIYVSKLNTSYSIPGKFFLT